jgi:hydroxyacylglutathione hydrolase
LITRDDILTFPSPGFGENGYLLRCGRSEAVAIDPGYAEGMLPVLAAEELRLSAILLTHAHIDHITGVAALVAATSAKVHLHAEAREWYDAAAEQGRWFGVPLDTPPPPEFVLEHGATLHFADITLEVRNAPGHAPGHVILYVPQLSAAFVGDVVFQGSIGRTDLPGGDYRLLMASIREQVLTLPEDTALYTGHGPPTTVGHERATNPFLIGHYGGELA